MTNDRPIDTVSQAVRELAAEDPHRPALSHAGVHTTYAALNGESDALAAMILDRLGPGDHRVAVRIADPRALLATPMGLCRAGKTNVSVDPTAPEARAAAMLADSEAALVVTDLDEDLGLPTLHAKEWLGASHAPVDVEVTGPAALIYTSGSTGGPKAISVSTAFLDRMGTWAQLVGLDAMGDRMGVLSTGSIGNSIAFYRAGMTLGKTMHPIDVRTAGLDGMTRWLLEDRISTLVVVPTLLRFLNPSLPADLVFPDLQVVFSYGESLAGQDARDFGRHLLPEAQIGNMYGLSETGLIAFSMLPAHSPLPDGPLPVGKPLPGTEVEILGPDRTTLLAPGETGEIAAAAHGMPDGYWRRDDLTAATFRELPDGRTRVLTGDAGSLDAHGVLHHQGRLDDVVKVAANRIALGDVEEALRTLPGVDSAVAAGRADLLGNVRLIAFVTGRDLDPRVVRTALARRLPATMLPDAVGVLDQLPTLPNGKVDRRSLPELAPPISSGVLAAGLEQQIGALFCRVLEIASVGPDDDFLALGGDSLRVAELFAALSAELGHDRPLSLILEAPTPALLAAALTHGHSDGSAGAGGEAGGEAEAESLVVARAEGSRPPLFVVHGALGNVVWLRDLAQHIDEDRPVYGIAAPALDGLWPRETSIDELAARYVRAARKVQPTGPYHLFGLSLGGSIVWEMARQLREAGEDIGYVGIGDTPLRPVDVAPRSRLDSLRERGLVGAVAHHVAWRLGKRDPDVSQWHEHLEASRRGVPVPFDRRGDFVQAAYGLLLRGWQPQPWSGPVTLFVPTTKQLSRVEDWQQLAGAVTTVTVPGDHYGMVREGAETLGRALDEGLTAATNAATPTSPVRR